MGRRHTLTPDLYGRKSLVISDGESLFESIRFGELNGQFSIRRN